MRRICGATNGTSETSRGTTYLNAGAVQTFPGLSKRDHLLLDALGITGDQSL